MKKIIIFLFLLFHIYLSALEKPLHITSSEYDLVSRLQSSGLIGKESDEKEILVKGKSMSRIEFAQLYGFLLLRRFSKDSPVYPLSSLDLKLLSELYPVLETTLDFLFLWDTENLLEALKKLKKQYSSSEKEINETTFVKPPEHYQYQKPAITEKKVIPSHYPENQQQVQVPSLSADEDQKRSETLQKALDSGIALFERKQDGEALMEFERARFFSIKVKTQPQMSCILFWLIRCYIRQGTVEQAEKYISLFAQGKFTPLMKDFNVSDPQNVFLEAEDFLTQHPDSYWLNYWTGSLYLHNSENQSKAAGYFKKVFQLTKTQN